MKVIDYDRLTVEGDGADYYVSFDNVAVGTLMGESMVEALADFDGVPNVVVLDGGPTDNNATLFGNGYMGAVQEKFDSGEWNLVDRQAVPDWDNVQAQTIMEQILTAAGNEVDGVIVANDGMAGGVIAALQAQGINGIPVTGQDATVGGIQNILLGDQYMTVYKAVKAEAFAAAELALALRAGESSSGRKWCGEQRHQRTSPRCCSSPSPRRPTTSKKPSSLTASAPTRKSALAISKQPPTAKRPSSGSTSQ